MKRIKLTQGKFALVDDELYPELSRYKWHAQWNSCTKSFYAVRGMKIKDGKQYRISMAREILGLNHDDKRQADHKNHNTLENCRVNLRIVTRSQNQWNQRNRKGYYWHKATKKYLARIMLNGKPIFLGRFDVAEDAHSAYLRAKKQYHTI